MDAVISVSCVSSIASCSVLTYFAAYKAMHSGVDWNCFDSGCHTNKPAKIQRK